MFKFCLSFVAAAKGYKTFDVTLDNIHNDLVLLDALKVGDIINVQGLEHKMYGQEWNIVIDYTMNKHIYEIISDQYVRDPELDEAEAGLRMT